MWNPIARYLRWLHTQWPAGGVEKLPEVAEDGSTNVPGLYVVGDLTGIPLLKFSSDTGARAVRTIAADASFQARKATEGVRDLVVIGGGVSGVAAMAEAKDAGLDALLIESARLFETVASFPKAKPIYTYPTDMTPAGELQFGARSDVKEGLLEELEEFAHARDIEPRHATVDAVRRAGGLLEVRLEDGETIRAHRVIVAIGRSGNFRTLDVPGEDLPHVTHRLHDPKEFAGASVLVVGGGDSALETARALAESGASVTLSYRKPEFSRAKPENVTAVERLEADGTLRMIRSSNVTRIDESSVEITGPDGAETVPTETVFLMIGREAPLDFFRRSGVRIAGEWRARTVVAFVSFLLFCVVLYSWKSSYGLDLYSTFKARDWFPFDLAMPEHAANLVGTVRISMRQPGFWYTLAYSACIVVFGVKRIRRRRTPYVTRQTVALAAIQVVPLFLLPYVLLPWAGHNGWFDQGAMKSVADALFPASEWDEHGREYWRSVGFILAWPLMIWNVFSNQPMVAWLVISLVQTFVIIPLLVWRWGKGAYCGWICTCGALAETMGDAHRHKMPHGPVWNRLNVIGQLFLLVALVLLVLRLVSWFAPSGSAVAVTTESWYMAATLGKGRDWSTLGFPLDYLNYAWFVDLLWAGIIGVGLYFWFSGRVWCRFACPLAALMHVYARFSQFRIVPEKSKCISCNVCTTVCHQGIDVMSFANRGRPMEDPECVRCSACVQSCPTGVLRFGRVNRAGQVIAYDRVSASPVRAVEMTVEGRRV